MTKLTAPPAWRSTVLRSPLLLALPTLLALLLSPSLVEGQDVELRVGQTLQGTLAPEDTVEYALEVGDDSFAFGEVNQISVDVVVRILDGEGQQRARIDVLGRGAERYASELEEAGRYTVQVFPDEEEDGGDYTITLRRLEPVATDPVQLVAQLMSPYDFDDTPGVAVQAWRRDALLRCLRDGQPRLRDPLRDRHANQHRLYVEAVHGLRRDAPGGAG